MAKFKLRTGKGTVYLAPCQDNQIALYNGAGWVLLQSGQALFIDPHLVGDNERADEPPVVSAPAVVSD